MYILHRRPKRSRTYIGLLVLAVILTAAGYVGKAFLRDETVIDPAPAAVTMHVADKRPPTKHFDTPLYSFDLPGDWESYTTTTVFQGMKSWRNAAKEKGIRSIDIYTDSTIGPTLAVNRVLPVDVQGDHLTPTGDVSENCTSFTPPDQKAAEGKTRAKWQNVEFLCDTGNYQRNVVGIAAPGGVNNVMLTGKSGARHQVLITYTDNAPNPDMSIISAMVQSFKLK